MQTTPHEGFNIPKEEKKTWFQRIKSLFLKIRQSEIDKVFIYLLVCSFFVLLFVENSRLHKRIDNLIGSINNNNVLMFQEIQKVKVTSTDTFCKNEVNSPNGKVSLCEVLLNHLMDIGVLKK